jgi:hypothetical protein
MKKFTCKNKMEDFWDMEDLNEKDKQNKIKRVEVVVKVI